MTRGTKQQITPHKIDQLKGVGDPANQEVWNNLTLPLEERFESYKHFVAHKVHEIAVGIERAGPEEARVIEAAADSQRFMQIGEALLNIKNDEFESKYQLQEALVLKGHSSSVQSITALTGGGIAFTNLDSTVRVWRGLAGREPVIEELKGHLGRVISVRELPNGGVVSYCTEGELRFWDRSTGGEWSSVRTESCDGVPNPGALCVLRDGRVATQVTYLSVGVFDASIKGVMKERKGHSICINCIESLPDGRIISGDDWGEVRVWRSASPSLLSWFGFSGDDAHVLQGHSMCVSGIRVLPDGRVVTGSWDSTVRVWTEGKDGTWSSTTLGCLSESERRVNCIETLPAGGLVTGDSDGTLRVWTESATGEWTVQCLVGHLRAVTAVAVLPNGTMVSGSQDGTLREWHRSGKGDWWSRKIVGHTAPITSLSLLACGHLASGGEDGEVRVWATRLSFEGGEHS